MGEPVGRGVSTVGESVPTAVGLDVGELLGSEGAPVGIASGFIDGCFVGASVPSSEGAVVGCFVVGSAVGAFVDVGELVGRGVSTVGESVPTAVGLDVGELLGSEGAPVGIVGCFVVGCLVVGFFVGFLVGLGVGILQSYPVQPVMQAHPPPSLPLQQAPFPSPCPLQQYWLESRVHGELQEDTHL